MTTGPMSQCFACTRLVAELGNWHCAAFPDGIPANVKRNGQDHRQPIDGDHGIRWKARDGQTFPEYASAR